MLCVAHLIRSFGFARIAAQAGMIPFKELGDQGDGGNYSAPSHVHFHNYRRLHSASYYLSMIEQGVGRQSMLIRNFIPGEETELRRVFMSSVHELARGFYTPEQLDAWAPVVHDKQDWADRIAALRPFVATINNPGGAH